MAWAAGSWGQAWAGSWGDAAASETTQVRVGRWRREPYEPRIWRKRKELPPEVEKAIEKTALKSVKRAEYRAKQVESVPAIDVTDPMPGLGRDMQVWLDVLRGERSTQLKSELKRSEIAWKAEYAAALQQEVQRVARERADEEHVLSMLYQYMH